MGYKVEGFSAGLEKPGVRESVDACLVEISQECPEILGYIQSPWARLALAWSGALMTCVKKAPPKIKKNASKLVTGQAHRENPVQFSFDRRPPTGEVHGNRRPATKNV